MDSWLVLPSGALFDSLFSHEEGERLSCTSAGDSVCVVFMADQRGNWNLRRHWGTGR